MREKLIELLGVALWSINWDWGDYPNTDELADHLIANGVNNIHIYAMNKPDVASEILSNISEIIK